MTTLEGGLCGFCQYANGDEFAASFNVYFRYVWRDYGIFFAFCGFQLGLIFIFSWLYLQGGKSLKQSLSPAARKEKKLIRQRNREASGSKA